MWQVNIKLKGRKLEHQGIRIEFIGQIGGCVSVLTYLVMF